MRIVKWASLYAEIRVGKEEFTISLDLAEAIAHELEKKEAEFLKQHGRETKDLIEDENGDLYIMSDEDEEGKRTKIYY